MTWIKDGRCVRLTVKVSQHLSLTQSNSILSSICSSSACTLTHSLWCTTQANTCWFPLLIPYPWLTSSLPNLHSLSPRCRLHYKTIKSQNVWRMLFVFLMGFHRLHMKVGVWGHLAPRYRSNPDMSTLIKLCAFEPFKDLISELYMLSCLVWAERSWLHY